MEKMLFINNIFCICFRIHKLLNIQKYRMVIMSKHNYDRWLQHLPLHVQISSMSDCSAELFFLTGSIIRFMQKHVMSDLKAAIVKRKWLNQMEDFDEKEVITWYINTVAPTMELGKIQVNCNLLNLIFDLEHFQNDQHFKEFVESTCRFVMAL